MKTKEKRRSPKGCLMYDLKWDGWLSILQTVDEKDVYGKADTYGYELFPHCTVFYGWVNDEKDWIIENENKFEFPNLKITGVGLFENPWFDVLKFNVESGRLKEEHSFCKQRKNETRFDYDPHVTIAYLKKGRGEKYVDELDFQGTFSILPFSLTYRYGTKNKVPIKKTNSQI
jgi:2'-5' RNA ligase